ncbi:MAG: sensor histidine kinase [Planctomycetota bacterium]
MIESSRLIESAPTAEEGIELRRLLEEYKGVTARLVASHDTLRAQLDGVRRELAEKNRELERKKRLEALGRVAAGVAHEFRNPLGGIRLTIDTLRRDLDGDRSHGRLDRIARAVGHLDHIVEDLMTFTRDPVLERSSIGIPTLIDDAIEIAFTGLDGVVPVIDRAGEAELEVFVDRHAFTQVLVNLIDNARRVMEQCGALDEEGPHIAIAWGRTAGLIDPVTWIEVADRGPGIPEGEEERIFHPFHSLRESGTGLGLAIVHGRIEAHGGEIAVVSDRRAPQAGYEGARFRIELPLTSEVR